MKPPEGWTEIVGGKRYSTDTAELLAGDDWWDGHNWERRGENTFLYRTQKGNYFSITLTQWVGKRDVLMPITQDEAMILWESLPERRCSFEDAFLEVVVEDA